MLWRWDYQSSDHQPLALICSIHDISYIKHCESLCACFKMHVYTIHNMYIHIYIYIPATTVRHLQLYINIIVYYLLFVQLQLSRKSLDVNIRNAQIHIYIYMYIYIYIYVFIYIYVTYMTICIGNPIYVHLQLKYIISHIG